MNTQNRHMQYRRSVYRKKRIKLILTIAAVSAVVIALLLVIIGNALGDKVENRKESDTDADVSDTVAQRREVKDVRASGVALNEEGSMLSSRFASVARSYDDACFYLDTADGKLLYVSSVASELGKQINGASDMRTASSIADLARSRELYTIGIMHVTDMNDDSPLIRSAVSGYYAARAAEALQGGIDDVMIYADALDDEIYQELILMAEQIHRLSDDGVVGLSLPLSVFTDSDSAALIDKLWYAFDYLAADLTDGDGKEADAATRVGEELSGMLYHLLRYNVRVLVPAASDAAEAEAIASAAEQSGAKSLVFMPTAVT